MARSDRPFTKMRYPTKAYLDWCDAVDHYRDRRNIIENDPAPLGEKWRQGQLRWIDEQLESLLSNEPPKYATDT